MFSQIYVSNDVATTTAQIKKGQKLNLNVKNAISEKSFINSDFRNRISKYQLVTLPVFAMFDPQATEMQSSKVECCRQNSQISL